MEWIGLITQTPLQESLDRFFNDIINISVVPTVNGTINTPILPPVNATIHTPVLPPVNGTINIPRPTSLQRTCFPSFASTSSSFFSNLGSIWAEREKNWLISPCGFLAITAQLPLSSAAEGSNRSSKVSSSTRAHLTRESSLMGTPSLYLFGFFPKKI